MTLIRHFEHNGKVYRHLMDMEDDSITLVDEADKELICYDASCDVMDISASPAKSLGRFVLENDYWIFRRPNGGVIETVHTIDMVEGLLDAEVVISRVWLNKQI